MAKFNDGKTRAAGPKSPMTTTGTTTTFEGGAAFTRDAKSELNLLAVTNMVGEDTFYERAKMRDDRFVQLVHTVTLQDPSWSFRFLGWLRNKANMRSASIVFAAEAIKARLDAGVHTLFSTLSYEVNGKQVPLEPLLFPYGRDAGSKDFVLQGMARADEPGEFTAYWTSKYGMALPKPVKRGLAQAVIALFDEYAYAKYGQPGDGYGLGRLVDLAHPKPKAPWQGELFEHALNELHKRDKPIPESLRMLHSRRDLMEIPQEDRRAFMANDMAADCFKRAGITWEALSGWLGGELDAKFWESLIPTMGYMALLRNLRNFEKAGISRSARKAVQERLSDPAQVAKSRQFPFRFLSAYKAVQGDWWNEALSEALDASVGNLPEFEGRTLVLVDTSGSMRSPISEKSSVSHAEVGALFGVALARAGADVDLHGFAGGSWANPYGQMSSSGGITWNSNEINTKSHVQFRHDLAKGGSILKGVTSFTARIGEVGHGTETVAALKETWNGHDRVILVTDMQAFGTYFGGASVTDAVPSAVRMYGINPSGYASTALDLSKPNRYEIGGFSDSVFRMISLIEAGNADWPF